MYIFDSSTNGGKIPANVVNMFSATSISDISPGIARNYMALKLGISVSLITPAQTLQGQQEILTAIMSPGKVTYSIWP
jgi:hypothetical protein